MNRKMKVQLDNSDRPWVAYADTKETLRAENLTVQVTAVRAVGEQGVLHETWRQLRALDY